MGRRLSVGRSMMKWSMLSDTGRMLEYLETAYLHTH